MKLSLPRIIFGLLAFAAILFFALIVIIDVAMHDNRPDVPNPKIVHEKDNEFTDRELGNIYAQRQEKEYEGKIITVSGVFETQGIMEERYPYVQMDVIDGGVLKFGIMCFLDTSKAQLAHPEQGERVKFTGKLRGLAGALILLEDCAAQPVYPN